MTNIRTYRAADLPRLYEIELSSFPEGIVYSYEYLEDLLESSESHTLIAEQNGFVVGFVLLCQEGKGGEISTIEVDPQFRRQGIAARLLLEIEVCAQARKIKFIQLAVQVTNKDAIALYERFGYKRGKGQINNYYGSGLEAFTFSKQL